MWQPDPAWTRLRTGPSSDGVWLTDDEPALVVKRLSAPADDARELLRPQHAGWWRREADVAGHPQAVRGPGLMPPEPAYVAEDEGGLTLTSPAVTGEPPPGLAVARALGRFAAAPYDEVPDWASRRLLADRLALAEERGGWPTLARTTLADVTDVLWRRRGHWLERLDAGPQGRVHGDAVPDNFVGRSGDSVVAADWRCFGIGPVGADVGYFALSSREEFDVLLQTFLDGAAEERELDVEAVLLAARVTAVYSVLARAEWALARAAKGEGALAGKLRHPAVAPYLRAVQRQIPQLEALV